MSKETHEQFIPLTTEKTEQYNNTIIKNAFRIFENAGDTTQKKVAEKLGFTRQGTISEFKNGHVTLDILFRIANAYNVTFGDLMDDTDAIPYPTARTPEREEEGAPLPEDAKVVKTLWDAALGFSVLDICCGADTEEKDGHMVITLEHNFLSEHLKNRKEIKDFAERYNKSGQGQGDELWTLFLQKERKRLQKMPLSIYSVQGIIDGKFAAMEYLRLLDAEIARARKEADYEIKKVLSEKEYWTDERQGPLELLDFYERVNDAFYSNTHGGWLGLKMGRIPVFLQDMKDRGTWREFTIEYIAENGELKNISWDKAVGILEGANQALTGMPKFYKNPITPTADQYDFMCELDVEKDTESHKEIALGIDKARLTRKLNGKVSKKNGETIQEIGAYVPHPPKQY